MSINFQLDYQSSDFVSDISETATIPIDGELFTGDQLKHLATEIMGIQYGLGLPGIRGGVVAAWGSNTVLGTGSASGTTVVFAATQTLVAGQLIAGASPTSTGFRRVTAGGTGLTFTVDSSFSAAISAATITSHYTVAQRIQDIETTQAATQARPVMLAIQRDAVDTDHDLEFTFHFPDGTTEVVTKQLDATWASGDNAGGMYSGDSLPTSGYLACWAVRSGAGALDVVTRDDTMTAPTLSGSLAGYAFVSPLPVFYTRTDSSANLRAFEFRHKTGELYWDDTLSLDLSVTDQGTSEVSRAAVNSVPGSTMMARLNVTHASETYVTVGHVGRADQAPTTVAAPMSDARFNGTVNLVSEKDIPVDDSGNYTTKASHASTSVYIQGLGFRFRQNL